MLSRKVTSLVYCSHRSPIPMNSKKSCQIYFAWRNIYSKVVIAFIDYIPFQPYSSQNYTHSKKRESIRTPTILGISEIPHGILSSFLLKPYSDIRSDDHVSQLRYFVGCLPRYSFRVSQLQIHHITLYIDCQPFSSNFLKFFRSLSCILYAWVSHGNLEYGVFV